MTKKEIDEFKDYMFKNRNTLGVSRVIEMEELFIKMVNQYKIEYPKDSKNIKRWRNWYRAIKNKLYPIPPEELGVLQYHLESFKVMDTDKAAEKLIHWVNRMEMNGYDIDLEIKDRIDKFINRYGYKIDW